MEGNQQKMREALERFMGWYNITSIRTASLRTIAEAARAALAAPPRQCDVGTPEEQDRRFGDFCRRRTCETCPCSVTPRCSMVVWAQMPYEAQEGGAK